MLESVLQYTRRYVPEEWNLDQQSSENLKSREEMAVIYHAHEAQQINTFQLQNCPDGHHLSLVSTKCCIGNSVETLNISRIILNYINASTTVKLLSKV